jgi:hypothetical protein
MDKGIYIGLTSYMYIQQSKQTSDLYMQDDDDLVYYESLMLIKEHSFNPDF